MKGILQDLGYALRQLRKSRASRQSRSSPWSWASAQTQRFSVSLKRLYCVPCPTKVQGQRVILNDPRDSDFEGENGGILYDDFTALKSEGEAFEDTATCYRNSGHEGNCCALNRKMFKEHLSPRTSSR